MDRLTERTADGILVKEDFGEDVLRTLYQCYGAEPMLHYANCEEGYCAMEKLAEYEDLEEQGKLLKLDDKYQKLIIGQEVWMIIGGNTVKQANISRISESWSDLYGFQGKYTAIPKTGRGGWDLKYVDFGKSAFLTKEEAEAALKEL